MRMSPTERWSAIKTGIINVAKRVARVQWKRRKQDDVRIQRTLARISQDRLRCSRGTDDEIKAIAARYHAVEGDVVDAAALEHMLSDRFKAVSDRADLLRVSHRFIRSAELRDFLLTAGQTDVKAVYDSVNRVRRRKLTVHRVRMKALPADWTASRWDSVGPNDTHTIKDMFEEWGRQVWRAREVTQGEWERLHQHRGPILDEKELVALDADISEEEIQYALSHVQNRKSPGPDGISVEAYKTCEFIPHLLAQEMNRICAEGALGYENLTTVVPVYKKLASVAERKLDNFRPIALINTDLRIMAYVMSRRFQVVAAKLIHPAQTAFVPERSILQNKRCVALAADAWRAHRRWGMLLHTDFRQAYDSIDREFLFFVLRMKGLRQGRAWSFLRAIFTDTISQVLVMGHHTGRINCYSGVLQGSPLSPILFAVTMDPLVRLIHEQKGIAGLIPPRPLPLRSIAGGMPLHDRGVDTTKMVAYADDIIFFISRPEEVEVVIELIKWFGRMSGLELNLPKCVVILMGLAMSEVEALSEALTPMQVKEADDESVRILGDPIPGLKNCVGIFAHRIQQMRKSRATANSQRRSGLAARHYANATIVAAPSFFAMTAPAQAADIKIMEQEMRAAFWGSPDTSKHKVAATHILETPMRDGGPGLMMPVTRLQAMGIGTVSQWLNGLNGKGDKAIDFDWVNAHIEQWIRRVIINGMHAPRRGESKAPLFNNWCLVEQSLRTWFLVGKTDEISKTIPSRVVEMVWERIPPAPDDTAVSVEKMTVNATYNALLARSRKERATREATPMPKIYMDNTLDWDTRDYWLLRSMGYRKYDLFFGSRDSCPRCAQANSHSHFVWECPLLQYIIRRINHACMTKVDRRLWEMKMEQKKDRWKDRLIAACLRPICLGSPQVDSVTFIARWLREKLHRVMSRTRKKRKQWLAMCVSALTDVT